MPYIWVRKNSQCWIKFYLDQLLFPLALECIKSAAEQSCRSHKKNNKNNSFGSTTSKSAPRPQPSTLNWPSPAGPPSTSCIWGAKCTTKAQLCTQIIIQEADILRAMRRYKSAAQVSNVLTLVSLINILDIPIFHRVFGQPRTGF